MRAETRGNARRARERDDARHAREDDAVVVAVVAELVQELLRRLREERAGGRHRDEPAPELEVSKS